MAGEMNAKVAAAEPAVRRAYAYVTYLAGGSGEVFLEAVVLLAKGLRKVGAAYPLVVVVSSDVPESHRDVLVSQGCVVREIEPVNPAQFTMSPRYSMLRVWELVEYDRMVYLGAGIHVLQNIDGLFDLDEGYFSAAEIGPPPPTPYFTAGTMFVHKPSAATAKALLDALRDTLPNSFEEQDFMIKFFRDQYKPIRLDRHLVARAMLGNTTEQHVQLHEAKRPCWWGETVLPFCSWLTTKAKVFARQNLPVMAVLTASSAAMGVVKASSANPSACFSFYVVLIVAIAALTFSFRNI